MGDACESVDVEAEIRIVFNGCKEHGHFQMSNGSMMAHGVGIFTVVDAALTVMVESIVHNIGDDPDIQRAVGGEYEWLWSQNGPEPLPDRAKKRLVRLMAHQLLLSHVASQDYMTDPESASLQIPFLD